MTTPATVSFETRNVGTVNPNGTPKVAWYDAGVGLYRFRRLRPRAFTVWVLRLAELHLARLGMG